MLQNKRCKNGQSEKVSLPSAATTLTGRSRLQQEYSAASSRRGREGVSRAYYYCYYYPIIKFAASLVFPRKTEKQQRGQLATQGECALGTDRLTHNATRAFCSTILIMSENVIYYIEFLPANVAAKLQPRGLLQQFRLYSAPLFP